MDPLLVVSALTPVTLCLNRRVVIFALPGARVALRLAIDPLYQEADTDVQQAR